MVTVSAEAMESRARTIRHEERDSSKITEWMRSKEGGRRSLNSLSAFVSHESVIPRQNLSKERFS